MRISKPTPSYGLPCALFLACWALSPSARAFTTILGPNDVIGTGWHSNTVTFDVDTSCTPFMSTVSDAINAAARVWGTVPTSALTIALGSQITLSDPITTFVGSKATAYAPVGNPIVYCDTAFGTTSPTLDPQNIPGYASAYNINESGQVTGALLVLNFQNGAAANVSSLDPTLAHVVLAHEIGHCLGIGHSADSNALMYFQSGPGRQLALSKDDIDAVTFLYPRHELTNSKFIGGCGVIQGRKGPPSDDEPFYNGNSIGLMTALYFLSRLGLRWIRKIRLLSLATTRA